ncbi:hypothetical protein CYMTET_6354 [Cymbomonas tetramitiformis]|uniref:Cytochrome P450 n=1 Tax=Cymbomonas tetramitiformis TaxID=36881 RepID=A0AAE0LI43_9CHLO|nr:hypothetical protein CYMTET_6354 [Cymbomonas tetramitiformis]
MKAYAFCYADGETDADFLRQILASKSFVKRDNPISQIPLDMYKKGLVLNPDVAVSRIHRRLFKSATQGQRFLESACLISCQKADRLLEIIFTNQCTEGARLVDVAKYFKLLTLDIIGRLAFGYDFGALEEGVKHALVSRIVKYLKGVQYFGFTVPLLRSKKAVKDFVENANYLRDLEYNTLKRAREELAVRGQDVTIEDAKSFPESLILEQQQAMAAADSGAASDLEFLDDNYLACDIRDMLLAGTDTSSNALTYIFYFLAKYPEKSAKVRSELESTLPTSYSDPQFSKMLLKLPYTDAFIKETMRLFFITPIIVREAAEDEVVNGLLIPKGTRVNLNLSYASTDPSQISQADEFLPERWLVPAQASMLSKIVFPFGHGTRNCVGQHIARVEMRAVLARILPNVDVHLLSPDQQVETGFDVVLHPKDDCLLLKFTRRNSGAF